METYNDAAKRLSEAYGLTVWLRDGVPTVGVPKTHIDKWFDMTIELGLTAGIAFQTEGEHRFSRPLSNISRSKFHTGNAFSRTGDPRSLGEAALHGHALGLNEIFEIEVQGTFTPTRVYRKICDGSYSCDHSSNTVKCLDKESEAGLRLLGKLVGPDIRVIYPSAW
jgi:hypothetical protein